MIRLSAYLLLPLLLTFVFGVAPVHAQQVGGLTVIPPKFELFANPGDSVTEVVRLKNESDSPMTFSVLVEDFSSTGEEGKVVLEEGESDSTYSLKRWIEPSVRNLTLQPGEEQPFAFKITVPSDGEPGGHYASVLFQIGSSEQIPGVATVQHRVGSLVLLRVSGNVVEQASVETFKAPAYSANGPVTFEIRVKNDGTTHIRPEGTILITNIFGRKVDEIPLDTANVFPGAVRRLDTVWDRTGMFGYYTATLVAKYGQQPLVLSKATKFAVASPVSLIVLTVGTLAVLVFVISIVSGRGRLLKAIRVLTTGKQ